MNSDFFLEYIVYANLNSSY